MDKWETAQKWESNWWGSCTNTYREETKQLVYARKMGLELSSTINVENRSILDIGGGPVSLLLKTSNLKRGVVIDPCRYPEWVYERYKSVGIEWWIEKGENIDKLKLNWHKGIDLGFFDEVWIYNCLQHVINPELIIEKAKKVCKRIRIFEWIDIPINIGHPHILTEENLDKWLSGTGKIEKLNEYGCNGNAYYGIFKGNL